MGIGVGRRYLALLLRRDAAARAKLRTDGDQEALSKIDAHPVEEDAHAGLLGKVDLVIPNNDADNEAILRSILECPTTDSVPK